jgi:hypothetical protein
VHGYEATAGIVNFLSETNRSFGGVHLFDVTSASTGATCEFTDVSSTATWQIFPMFKFLSFSVRDAIAVQIVST